MAERYINPYEHQANLRREQEANQLRAEKESSRPALEVLPELIHDLFQLYGDQATMVDFTRPNILNNRPRRGIFRLLSRHQPVHQIPTDHTPLLENYAYYTGRSLSGFLIQNSSYRTTYSSYNGGNEFAGERTWPMDTLVFENTEVIEVEPLPLPPQTIEMKAQPSKPRKNKDLMEVLDRNCFVTSANPIPLDRHAAPDNLLSSLRIAMHCLEEGTFNLTAGELLIRQMRIENESVDTAPTQVPS